MIECWQLLDGLLGPVNGEPRRHLMLPSRQYFPATTASGQAAHLGFGLFGANTAFEFRQFTDFDRQGWSYSRSGYLGESEWGFALGLLLVLQGREPKEVSDFVKPHLLSVVKRAHRYLVAHSEVIAPLRRPQAHA